MATFIRCGYFVRKCRFSSTSGGNVGYVLPCDAADGGRRTAQAFMVW